MLDDDDRVRSIKQKAVALLAVRERSRFILRNKLKEKFSEPEDLPIIDACLDELEGKGYLSDERFVRASLVTKASRFGDQRLKWELRCQGVNSETINSVMEEFEESEFERAKTLWERKFGELPEDQKERARQFRFLASRGFSFKTINQIIKGDWDEFE